MAILGIVLAIDILAAIAWLILREIFLLIMRVCQIGLGEPYGAIIAALATSLTGIEPVLPIIAGFLTCAWLTALLTRPTRRKQTARQSEPAPVRKPTADRAVAQPWDKAPALVPGEPTAILEPRTPCAILRTRSASNVLDFPTIEVVQIIRRHVPELIDAHCGIISTLDPARRALAIAELIRDLTTIASMAQARLDFITARPVGLTKSRVAAFEQCPRRLWLQIHAPELVVWNEGSDALFAFGNELGEAACALLPHGVMIEAEPDLSAALEKPRTG